MSFRSLPGLFLAGVILFTISACSGNSMTPDPIRPAASVNQSGSTNILNVFYSNNGDIQIIPEGISDSLVFEWRDGGITITNNGATVYELQLDRDNDKYTFGIVETGMTTSPMRIPFITGQNALTLSYKQKPAIEIGDLKIQPSGFDFSHAVITGDSDGYIDNEVLFGFKDGAPNNERLRIINQHNLFLVGLNSKLGMHTGRFYDDRTVQQVITELKSEPLIKWPTINGLAKAQWAFPNDPAWNMNYPEEWRWNMMRIEAYKAWDIYKDGVEGGVVDATVKNIVLCIADTGVYPHEDLNLNAMDIWIARTYSQNFDSPGGTPLDYYGHGSSVAGIAGGMGNNGKGVAGICWDPYFLSLKCLSDYGWGSFEAIGNSIHYIGELAEQFPWLKFIANYSLGGGMADPWNQEASTYTNSFPNTLLIAAAGNWGYETYSYPATFAEFYSIGASSIMIQGYNDKEVYAECPSGWGTNWNDKVFVCAPGSMFVPTTNIPWTIMYDYPDQNCPYNCDGWYCDHFGGTSAATPHVTGLSALLWSKAPTATKEQIMQRIAQTCDPMSIPPEKVGKLGAGRINCYRALTNK